MIPSSVEAMLRRPTDESIAAMLDDDSAVFMVDWREDDELIIEYCESVLKTGALSAQVVETSEKPGFEGFITFQSRRVRIPWVMGVADRHITLHTLNQLLLPAYEIRVCVDSNGSDTLAFLPLPGADWQDLESRFGEEVRWRFGPIDERPNLFTEAWRIERDPDGIPRVAKVTLGSLMRGMFRRRGR